MNRSAHSQSCRLDDAGGGLLRVLYLNPSGDIDHLRDRQKAILPFLIHKGYFTSPLLHCTDSSESGDDGDKSYPCLHTKSIKSPCKIFPS